MATWPAYGFLKLPYGEAPESALARSDMENGLPKQAKIKSKVIVQRAITMVYTFAEYGTFKTFFNTTISRGADWFDWTDPADDTVKQARIQDGVYQSQSFVTSPGAPLSWEVSFILETLE